MWFGAETRLNNRNRYDYLIDSNNNSPTYLQKSTKEKIITETL